MIRYLVVMAVGYILGAKAGRRRYEQFAGTARAVTASPAGDGGREGALGNADPL